MYVYKYDDEFNEFQLICDLLNFESIEMTIDNVHSLRKMADDLQINSVLQKIDDKINECEKVSKSIDEQQNNIEIINLLLKNNKIDVNLLQTKLNGTISFDDFEKWFDSDGSIYTNTRKNIDYFENKIEKMSELHLAILKENIQIIKLLLKNKNIETEKKSKILSLI